MAKRPVKNVSGVAQRKRDEAATPGTRWSTNYVIDPALRAVQDRFREEGERLRALDEEHNSLVPAGRLLPELLSQIIHAALAKNGAAEAKTYPQIVVSHVCRRWRSIVLDDSSLWTTPRFENTAWTRTMIERSRNAPLDVDIKLHKNRLWSGDTLVRALKNSGGIRLFHITADCKTLTSVFNKLSALPLLQSLMIHNPNPWTFVLHSPTLEEEDVSHLQTLFLLGCSVPWNSNCFNNISFLSIQLTCYNGKFNSAHGLPDAKLESERIVLPNLTELHLGDDLYFDRLHHILATFRTPRLTHLKIDVRDQDDDDDPSAGHNSDFAALCKYLGVFLHEMIASLRKLEAQRWREGWRKGNEVDHSIWGTGLKIICEGRRPVYSEMKEPLLIALSVRKEYEEVAHASSPEEDVATFLKCAPIQQLQDVSFKFISDNHGVDPMDFGCVLDEIADLPSLQQLMVITENGDLSISSALLERLTVQPLGTNPATVRMPFPALQSLRCVTETPRVVRDDDPEGQRVHGSFRVVPPVMAVLESRELAGVDQELTVRIRQELEDGPVVKIKIRLSKVVLVFWDTIGPETIVLRGPHIDALAHVVL